MTANNLGKVRLGWWASHDYKRRSVEHDLQSWPGWAGFMRLFEKADNPPYPRDSKKYAMLKDSRRYAIIIFETGCREMEAVKLKPSQFRWDEDSILVENAPVLKKGRRATRDILIKLDDKNPLGYSLVEYLEACEPDEYLMPGLKKFSREVEPWRHVSPKTVYNRITEMSPELWPHALRGYRASMLVNERGFSVQNLMKWFSWRNADSAVHYTATKDMAEAMGIDRIPQGRG